MLLRTPFLSVESNLVPFLLSIGLLPDHWLASAAAWSSVQAGLHRVREDKGQVWPQGSGRFIRNHGGAVLGLAWGPQKRLPKKSTSVLDPEKEYAYSREDGEVLGRGQGTRKGLNVECVGLRVLRSLGVEWQEAGAGEVVSRAEEFALPTVGSWEPPTALSREGPQPPSTDSKWEQPVPQPSCVYACVCVRMHTCACVLCGGGYRRLPAKA